MLDELGIASDVRVISAHRTPERLVALPRERRGRRHRGRDLRRRRRGAPGGRHRRAHDCCPCSASRSRARAAAGPRRVARTVQMPGGIPVATFAIGKAGREERGPVRRARSSRAATRRCASGSKSSARRRAAAVPERPPSRLRLCASRARARQRGLQVLPHQRAGSPRCTGAARTRDGRWASRDAAVARARCRARA